MNYLKMKTFGPNLSASSLGGNSPKERSHLERTAETVSGVEERPPPSSSRHQEGSRRARGAEAGRIHNAQSCLCIGDHPRRSKTHHRPQAPSGSREQRLSGGLADRTAREDRAQVCRRVGDVAPAVRGRPPDPREHPRARPASLVKEAGSPQFSCCWHLPLRSTGHRTPPRIRTGRTESPHRGDVQSHPWLGSPAPPGHGPHHLLEPAPAGSAGSSVNDRPTGPGPSCTCSESTHTSPCPRSPEHPRPSDCTGGRTRGDSHAHWPAAGQAPPPRQVCTPGGGGVLAVKTPLLGVHSPGAQGPLGRKH